MCVVGFLFFCFFFFMGRLGRGGKMVVSIPYSFYFLSMYSVSPYAAVIELVAVLRIWVSRL